MGAKVMNAPAIPAKAGIQSFYAVSGRTQIAIRGDRMHPSLQH